MLITSVEKGVNILAAARIRAASGALWPLGTEGRRTGTRPPCGQGDGRRPAGRHPPLAYSAALPTAWAPWIPPMQRGPRPHSFGHTEPMVRPAGFGAGERVDVTSCMEARNAPWPAGDGLDGAEAVPCIAGEPLRCGGGCAVHLRFGVQCTCDSGIPGCRKSAWSSKSAWSRRTACRALHTTVRGSFRCFDQCWFRWRRAGGVGVAK
ncbi:MAG: hypothetical protein JWN05_3415 [Arthrobacter sp.]|nr:hypothetical protein [Arthrobacter sp.]